MYGQDMLCGILKGTFEISCKILYPYLKIYGLMGSRNFKSSVIQELVNIVEMAFWTYCGQLLQLCVYHCKFL